MNSRAPQPVVRSTTILSVRRSDSVAIGGDGQVTLGQTTVKHDAQKIRSLADGLVLCGFAGAAADADGGAVHEKGCGERVAEDVGRHLLGNTGAKRNVLGAVLDGLRTNGPAVWPDEDEVAVSGAAVEVLLEPGEGGGTEIDRALFVALADNLSLALGKVE